MSLFARLLRDAKAKLACSGLSAALEKPGMDSGAQARVLEQLLRHFARSDYGRAHRLEPGLSASEFSKRVPLMTTDTLAPILHRHEHNGGYLLSDEACCALLESPQLPGEPTHRFPLTASARRQFHTSWKTALYAGCLHHVPASHLSQGALLLGELALSAPSKPPPTLHLDDLVAESARRLQHLQGMSLSGEAKLDGEAPGILLTGDPLWLATLFPEPIIVTDVGSKTAERPPWTRALTVLVSHRQSTRGIADQARLLLGHPVRTHEILATEAGVLATQTGENELGLRMLTGHGIFFEFVPVADYDPKHLERMSEKTLTAEHLMQGESYVLIVSTLAGLCRHDTGERVRCLSVSPLRILPEGKQTRVISLAGEQLTEHDTFAALSHCCDRHDWAIVHMHVAPMPATSKGPKSHEWWVELKPGSRETPTGPALGELLDIQLRRQCSAYAALRQNGILTEPVVRLVIPGVFKSWLQTHALMSPNFCMPRCLPSRTIADALAALARFCD